MFPGLDLHCADPVQHLITAGLDLQTVDDLDRDLSVRRANMPEVHYSSSTYHGTWKVRFSFVLVGARRCRNTRRRASKLIALLVQDDRQIEVSVRFKVQAVMCHILIGHVHVHIV